MNAHQYDLNWLKEARNCEESLRNAPVKTLMNKGAIEKMRYLLRVALDTLERILVAPPDGIVSIVLVGNVDADETLFRAAVDFAYVSSDLFAIAAVDTITDAYGPDEHPRLAELAREAEKAGIAELVFNLVEET